jgi:hypothetical protein
MDTSRKIIKMRLRDNEHYKQNASLAITHRLSNVTSLKPSIIHLFLISSDKSFTEQIYHNVIAI